MPLDPKYILMQDLEEILIDKDTGLLLSNGTIEFWADNSRNTPQAVYELTGSPPNYNYAALPNPLDLSIIGTPRNAANANIAIYYKPYDDFGNLSLYYIVVKNSTGTVQFTREAWPNTVVTSQQIESENANINLLSNPQFVDVNFDPTQTLTLTIGGAGTYTYPIAPGWDLVAAATGAATLTVARNNVTGIIKNSTNPAYTMTFSSSANISQLKLRQRLEHNPGIWGANALNQGGYVATTVSFGPQASSLQVVYEPSVGLPFTMLNATNNTGTFLTYNNTSQVPASTNTDSSAAGYVDISVFLPTNQFITLTSIQCTSLNALVANVPYEQAPVARQQDQLAHYYKPQLQYKPIPSFLVGWDFPMNPSQFYADGIRAAQAIGANKSEYKWDQTIVFQSADSGVAVSRGTLGSFKMTAAANGQVAVIQYIPAPLGKEAANSKLAVYLNGFTTKAGGIAGKVTIWATDQALPNIAAGTNNSLVSAIDATGFPTCGNGTWTQIPRSLGDAYFALSSTASDIYLNGWDLAAAAPSTTATCIAIVVGFAAWTSALPDTIELNSVSLCAGNMATRPAPKTAAETKIDCNQFYWKTFNQNVTPAQNVGANTGEYRYTVTQAAAGDNYSPSIIFPTPMRTIPTITFYNPAAANAQARNLTQTNDAAATNTTDCGLSAVDFNLHTQGQVGWTVGDRLAVHITADARLGIN